MPKIPKNNKDMHWYVKGRKKPVCGCTTASGLLVEILHEQYGTFAEALEHINYDEALEHINYDEEARQVCRKMIDAGCE